MGLFRSMAGPRVSGRCWRLLELCLSASVLGIIPPCVHLQMSCLQLTQENLFYLLHTEHVVVSSVRVSFLVAVDGHAHTWTLTCSSCWPLGSVAFVVIVITTKRGENSRDEQSHRKQGAKGTQQRQSNPEVHRRNRAQASQYQKTSATSTTLL